MCASPITVIHLHLRLIKESLLGISFQIGFVCDECSGGGEGITTLSTRKTPPIQSANTQHNNRDDDDGQKPQQQNVNGKSLRDFRVEDGGDGKTLPGFLVHPRRSSFSLRFLHLRSNETY